MTKTLLIVPAFNEEESISKTVSNIREHELDFIVVNDGSSDATECELQRISAPHIELIQNLGIGGAVQTGYKYALRQGYDIAVQFDGDGQHDASYVACLLEPIETGEADIVVGSRFVGDESEFRSSLARRMGIRLLSWALKIATGHRIHDVTSGFRAVNRRGIELFARNYPTDYPEPESLALASTKGLRISEIPVVMHARNGGKSSIGMLDAGWYMIKVSISIIVHGNYRRRR